MCWKERPSVPVYAEPRSFKFTRGNLIFEQEESLWGGRTESEAEQSHLRFSPRAVRPSANCRHARCRVRLCCDQPARRDPRDGSFPLRSQRGEANGQVIYGSSQQIKWGWFAVLTRTPVRHTLTTWATLYLRPVRAARREAKCDAHPCRLPDARNWTAASMIMAMHTLGAAAEKEATSRSSPCDLTGSETWAAWKFPAEKHRIEELRRSR